MNCPECNIKVEITKQESDVEAVEYYCRNCNITAPYKTVKVISIKDLFK